MNIRLFIPDGKQKFLFTQIPRINEAIKALDERGDHVEIGLLPNNNRPLTVVYNEFLKDIRENHKDTDYAVLLHSDVAFDIVALVDRLKATEGKYDLVGLAGAKKVKASQVPLTWYTGSIPFPDERYGRISMDVGGRVEESFYNARTPGVIDTPVAMVDGLCLVLGKKMLESDIQFDEQFTNDFYDSDLCMECWRRGFKIGVFVLPTMHLSVGDSVNTNDFLAENEKFCKKWGLQFKVPESRAPRLESSQL